jgi:hypothetical protein
MAVINADGSFLDPSCDRAASLVNLQQLRCGRASCAERWDDSDRGTSASLGRGTSEGDATLKLRCG